MATKRQESLLNALQVRINGLEELLRWSVREGVYVNTPPKGFGDGKPSLRDAGCGCCSGSPNPPPHEALFWEVVGARSQDRKTP